MSQNVWIIGCGDIGCRLADLYQSLYQKQSDDTSGNKQVNDNDSLLLRGIVSSEASRKDCEKQGINVLQLDLSGTYQLPLKLFAKADVYYFVPPPKQGEQDTTLENFLACFNLDRGEALPRRVVLISTTGVYGDSKGEWIDETTPLNPVADRAKRRHSAELLLQQWAESTGSEYMIIRVPGIYAEERLPLERLQKSLPVVNAAEAGYTNRIHADDLAQICKIAMQSQKANQIYNATDGHPSTMTDYFNQVADYANLPRPPQITLKQAEQTLSAGMVSYLKESRRISNAKMLEELGVVLKYPSLEYFFKKAKTAKSLT